MMPLTSMQEVKTELIMEEINEVIDELITKYNAKTSQRDIFVTYHDESLDNIVENYRQAVESKNEEEKNKYRKLFVERCLNHTSDEIARGVKAAFEERGIYAAKNYLQIPTPSKDSITGFVGGMVVGGFSGLVAGAIVGLFTIKNAVTVAKQDYDKADGWGKVKAIGKGIAGAFYGVFLLALSPIYAAGGFLGGMARGGLSGYKHGLNSDAMLEVAKKPWRFVDKVAANFLGDEESKQYFKRKELISEHKREAAGMQRGEKSAEDIFSSHSERMREVLAGHSTEHVNTAAAAGVGSNREGEVAPPAAAAGSTIKREEVAAPPAAAAAGASREEEGRQAQRRLNH